MQLPGAAQLAVLAVGVPLGRVAGVVTLLAQGRHVVIGIVARVVIQMRDGQHDDAAGDRMRPAVLGMAPFTAAAGALETDALAGRAQTVGDGPQGSCLRPRPRLLLFGGYGAHSLSAPYPHHPSCRDGYG